MSVGDSFTIQLRSHNVNSSMAGELCDRVFWEQFLEKYKSFPALWNNKSSSYNDKSERNKAHQELIAFCKPRYPNANRYFITRKIHNFRTAFRREVRKIRSRDPGCDPHKKHVSNLWYFNILSFLTDVDCPAGKKGPNCDDENSNVSNTDKILIIISSTLSVEIFFLLVHY